MVSIYLLIYYVTCKIYLVFFTLVIPAFVSLKTFKALSQRPIADWLAIKVLYRVKVYVLIFWVTGYSIFMIVLWIIGIDDLIKLTNTIPIAIGVVLDIYFTYCVYSCYILGIRGKFDVVPDVGVNQIENFTVRKADPNAIPEHQCFRSEKVKEVTAFPEKQFIADELKENNIELFKDFTNTEKNQIEHIQLKY